MKADDLLSALYYHTKHVPLAQRPTRLFPTSPTSTPTMSMERRHFIQKGAAAIAATGVLAGCSSESSTGEAAAVQTRPNVRWRLASSFPRSLDTIYGIAETLSQRLEQLTDGRFTIRVYPQGELVPATEILGSVQTGTIQIGHTASYYYIGKNEALAFDTCVPFGLTTRQHYGWMLHGGGMELMRSLFAEYNIVNFLGGNTGGQMGGWYRREINSLADLRGIKMRIPGLGGKVMDRLGVSVQVLAGGDIYPALERGAIDATEWVGPYDDEKLGFHDVAGYYYAPGWWEPTAALSFMVNKEAYDALPPTYQHALEVATQMATLDMMARYDALNPAAIKRIKDRGIQVRQFSQDIMEAAYRASRELMEETATSNPQYKRVFDAYDQFRKDSYAWAATNELPFAEFAYRNT